METITKTFAVIMVLAMLLSLAACGGSGASASPLVGTWENSEYGTSYTFNADGTCTLAGEGYSMDLTYEDKGAAVDLAIAGSSEIQNQEYTIDGDTLTLAGISYTKK